LELEQRKLGLLVSREEAEGGTSNHQVEQVKREVRRRQKSYDQRMWELNRFAKKEQRETEQWPVERPPKLDSQEDSRQEQREEIRRRDEEREAEALRQRRARQAKSMQMRAWEEEQRHEQEELQKRQQIQKQERLRKEVETARQNVQEWRQEHGLDDVEEEEDMHALKPLHHHKAELKRREAKRRERSMKMQLWELEQELEQASAEACQRRRP